MAPVIASTAYRGHFYLGALMAYTKQEKRVFAYELWRNMTKAELLLYKHLGMVRPKYFARSQFVAGGYILDFFIPKENLAIEVDGSVHDKQKEYDARRSEHLLNIGIRTIRFTNSEVFANPALVVREILEYIGKDRYKYTPDNHEMRVRSYILQKGEEAKRKTMTYAEMVYLGHVIDTDLFKKLCRFNSKRKNEFQSTVRTC